MSLASPWTAALIALFAWWASTGAMLVVVRWADRAGRPLTCVLATLPVGLAGAAGFWLTLEVTSVAAVYGAFFSALAVWAWLELAFLTGIVTGPHHLPARPGVPEWERFIRAWGTVAYHEMTLTAALIAMALTAQGAANRIGLWTFAILYVARISAKLNLYLGVRKVNTEFIPRPLAHLPSHFREARINWLFPTSVTGLSFAVACLLERVVLTEMAAAQVGFSLLAAVCALALLEHWFMVVRLPDEKLWRWMLPKRETLLKEGPDAVR
ncbi:putative photosynthetic complex assembly protein PuhE [Jannaschia seohaensis]|uniref:Putative photosynthetic complex assembly protein 2 n=1 Tax=Jannaschia seohaensis TaxID=475081 RepID=A0A2Y9A114_9RHOB|nr:putative photosynthetic complex assembly protein PuhE [Jannaschia seohaensis]PWJ21697.1 putative photosynthetic complex assembly protein 2 [Jannaschia seohaensis]SSA37975.1 putative photosynthetic complex assembly protein 2 [Jannaschia seohaensis]